MHSAQYTHLASSTFQGQRERERERERGRVRAKIGREEWRWEEGNED